MSTPSQFRILVLGAGYGLLFAVRAALGSHHVTVVCRLGEAELLNTEGPVINIPARKTGETMQISHQNAALDIVACGPGSVDPNAYDIVILAMQEAQFCNPEVSDLTLRIARSGRPVISIMNMTLPPYLKGLEGVWQDAMTEFYHAADVWSAFPATNFTHCSPDPQAIRPDISQSNVINVTLASNFKIAPFALVKHNQILSSLCKSSNTAAALRCPETKPRVNLLASGQVFVPMAKWPMLVTGNYRCVTEGKPQSIAQAVAADPEASRRIYECTLSLCKALGAPAKALVSYETYAAAASNLNAPSSVAKALAIGQGQIERMDKVIQFLHRHSGLQNPDLDKVVEIVDSKLT